MSPVSRKAVEAITELNRENDPIGGRLGIPIDGIRQVNVANRPGFVYVRLRDNSNELVQAFNESVSPVYDLPVLVEFKNNRYVVIGRDTDRYSSWGSDSSYLPAHASQHSMLANQMGGGDPVFVDGRQMMPGAAYPSGTLGGPNVLISDFLFRNKLGNWLYIGNTGTADLNTLRPNGSNARMVLVCLDYTSGGFVILTGSTFSATLTGTSQIWPYVPNNNLDQVPLAAIRIVSGTTSIGWDNIYDARQWIDSGFPTGSSGGGGGTPGGNDTNVQFNNAGAFAGVDSFSWNNSTGLYIGAPGTLPLENGLIDLVAEGDGSPRLQFWQFGESAAATILGHKANGTYLSPSTVLQNNELMRIWAKGYYGSGWSDVQGSFQFVAGEDWTATGTGVGAQLFITPVGSTTLTLAQDWDGSFSNLYMPLNMNTNYIHNVVDPVLDQDAMTLRYANTHYAPTGTGVTGGNSHNHVGGDGAPIKYRDHFGGLGLDATIAAGATQNIKPWGNGFAAIGSFNVAIPSAGVYKNLYLRTAGAQPASGTLVCTLVINNVPSALVVTVAAGSAAGIYSDTTNTVTVVAGDVMWFSIKNNAAGASAPITSTIVMLEMETN